MPARVIHLLSPRRAYEDWRRRPGDAGHCLVRLIPTEERRAPVVTVFDRARCARLFGQSGSRKDLYWAMRIDMDRILEVSFDAVEKAY